MSKYVQNIIRITLSNWLQTNHRLHHSYLANYFYQLLHTQKMRKHSYEFLHVIIYTNRCCCYNITSLMPLPSFSFSVLLNTSAQPKFKPGHLNTETCTRLPLLRAPIRKTIKLVSSSDEVVPKSVSVQLTLISN